MSTDNGTNQNSADRKNYGQVVIVILADFIGNGNVKGGSCLGSYPYTLDTLL